MNKRKESEIPSEEIGTVQEGPETSAEDDALDAFEWGRNPVTTAAFRIADLIVGRGEKRHARKNKRIDDSAGSIASGSPEKPREAACSEEHHGFENSDDPDDANGD